MDGPDPRTHGDVGTEAEDWLRARLTAHAGEVPVAAPDIAGIDARRRGIRRRRTAWAVCAASAVTAGAVVTAVAFAGGGAPGGSADPLPLAPPTTTAAPTENPATPAPAPPGTATAPPPPGTEAAPGTGFPDGMSTAGPGATTTAPGTPTTSATTPQGTGGTRGNAPAPGASSGSSSGDATNGATACTDKNIAISASTSPNDSGRHILLTATNTGSTTCTLYFSPDIVLGDGSRDVVPMESPAAVATIAPGKKAYSGLLLFKPGEQVDQVTSFAVNLRDRGNQGHAGNPIDVAIPSGLGGALDVGPYPGTYFWNTDLAQLNTYLYAR
ncbi:DUF4232 domain-containing protein [Yinghuangia sp. ASG 101]|uniref:DUF4232 domain-containing protein n=1 Tax=Yinghuangia sp. ASG 101 TaxID=2896848 RepID=UPI001E5B6C5F|nr:DUF4232 domain-containing protein [Yinghuangia sp. ASG 101]UGQ11863.1 DUF4232 domain-containing protein [Yinghuangia sp. ASG 101]